ncbi:MAG: MoaD/ThiS family protein [Rhodospirillales bacterium]|nr:MoaD/ThiS family protein [Rhodospirillales bacterium]
MTIRQRVDRLLGRLADAPLFPTQGAVLFVDLERQETRKGYLPHDVVRTFLGGRGANMFLLYNLMQDGKDALDPEIPLIFGAGIFTGNVAAGTRSNVTSISPESRAILDANCGDYFPSWMRRHGYDHIVLHGRASAWTLLRIAPEGITFHDAAPYVGLDNLDTTAAVERDFACKERKDMAMARITSAGENLVLTSGIMGGIKAIWARGGGGAKMGSMKLKAIMIQGKLPEAETFADLKPVNKEFMDKILSASVVKNALRKVGTPFLYKPCRIVGALGAKNNQETTWTDSLDADNFDVYRPGMDGCYKCPVRCRAGNDMLPDGKGGWGANALKGLTGNASYDRSQAEIQHERQRSYNGINDDGVFDRYDHGDGPEFTTLGRIGPNLGITKPEHVLRLNNVMNDLGLDSASTGGALSWAFELYQRGIIGHNETGGLELTWGNYPVIEKLLFMTAKREGFGDVIADSSRAVERGKYPAEAESYRMTVKGLFQSDPHDARILKAFALGLAVATRGMDHLRNRATLEINAKVNDSPEFKRELYGAEVSPQPTSYEGKEHAVRKCENTYAVGDSLGMCRFNTKLFNSPSTGDYDDFARLLETITGQRFTAEEMDEVGRNVTGIERMINFRLGLRAADDTLPRRWFEESNTAGPFKGEKIDRAEFEKLKARFYEVTGLNREGAPKAEWHERLADVVTAFKIRVNLPKALPGAPDKVVIVDEPVDNVVELRQVLARRLPEAAAELDGVEMNVAVNGDLLLSGEAAARLRSGDEVTMIPALAGG